MIFKNEALLHKIGQHDFHAILYARLQISAHMYSRLFFPPSISSSLSEFVRVAEPPNYITYTHLQREIAKSSKSC
jgi:hypothetical protein